MRAAVAVAVVAAAAVLATTGHAGGIHAFAASGTVESISADGTRVAINSPSTRSAPRSTCFASPTGATTCSPGRGGLVDAQITAPGVFYAADVRVASGSRGVVTFVPLGTALRVLQ